MNKTYSEYVKLGKDLVSKIEAYQAKIAEYACTVCNIRHGGRSNGYYTIKDYANDIGVSYKTVQNWVRVYRNVIKKIDAPKATKKDWERARKTNDMLTMQITVENDSQKTPRKKKLQSIPKQKVQSLYDQLCDDEKPFIMEFNRMMKSAKHAKGLLSKRDLGLVSEKELLHLMNILDQSSDYINDYLTAKKKAS